MAKVIGVDWASTGLEPSRFSSAQDVNPMRMVHAIAVYWMILFLLLMFYLFSSCLEKSCHVNFSPYLCLLALRLFSGLTATSTTASVDEGFVIDVLIAEFAKSMTAGFMLDDTTGVEWITVCAQWTEGDG